MVKHPPSNADNLGFIPGWEVKLPYDEGQLSLSTAARESQSPATNSPHATTKTQCGQKEKEKNRICKEPWISKGQITPYRTCTKTCIGISWMETLVADKRMERHTLLVIREWKWEPQWALIKLHYITRADTAKRNHLFILLLLPQGPRCLLQLVVKGEGRRRSNLIPSGKTKQLWPLPPLGVLRPEPPFGVYLAAKNAGKWALCGHFLNRSYSSTGEKNVIGAKPEVSTSTENYIQYPMISHKSIPGGSDGKESAAVWGTRVQSLDMGRSPGVGNSNLLSILAWETSCPEKPGRLQSMGWHGVTWTRLNN